MKSKMLFKSKMNIILKQYLANISRLSENDIMRDEVDKIFNEMGDYELFNIIGKNRLFYIGLVLFIVFGYFIYKPIHLGVLFGFILVVLIYVYYIRYMKNNIKAYVHEKDDKLKYLNLILSGNNRELDEGALEFSDYWIYNSIRERRSYLYLNPVVVAFYYKMRLFLEYSYMNYHKSLVYINLIIYLGVQIKDGVNNRGQQYETFKLLKKNCLNYWQAIIQSLPSSKGLYNKFNDSIYVLHSILNAIEKEVVIKIKEQNIKGGMNTEYAPVYPSLPKANDVGTYNYSDKFDFFS